MEDLESQLAALKGPLVSDAKSASGRNERLREEMTAKLIEEYELLRGLVALAAHEWNRDDWARANLGLAEVRRKIGEEIEAALESY
jgi:hypothetical protein